MVANQNLFRQFLLFATGISILILLNACRPKDAVSPASYECPEECQDAQVLRALLRLRSSIYEANFKGYGSTYWDKTVSCSNGGSVRLSGPFIVDGTKTSVDIVFDFTDCKVFDSSWDVLFQGKLRWSGIFFEDGSASLQYASPNNLTLAYSGSLLFSGFQPQAISGKCELSIKHEVVIHPESIHNHISSNVTGGFCGRSQAFVP